MTSSESSLRARLEQEIRSNGVIFYEKLHEICTVETIKCVLSDQLKSETVWARALKLFAILVLLENSHLVLKLIDKNCYDSHFFRTGTARPYCSSGVLRAFPELNDIRDDFLEKQWLIPPVLSHNTHHHFPTDFLAHFPAVAVNGMAKERNVKGADRRIRQITIGGGQIESRPQSFVAVRKENRQDYSDSWYKVISEIKSMRNRKHDHILELLASFDVTSEDEWKKLFMIFEYTAEGNMKAFMREKQTPYFLRGNPNRANDFLYETVESLASGLAFLHRQVGDFLLCHFDLKPSNVLLFREHRGETPKYIWKISDFGNSDLIYVPRGFRSRVDESTPEYMPPEFYTPGGFRDTRRRHGREFDIFPMGCIFLEVATLIVHGWDSNNDVVEFARRRNQDSSSFRLNMNIVKDQIGDLERYQTTDADRLHYLLDIIRDMIREDPVERLHSFEVALRTFDLHQDYAGSASSHTRQMKIAELAQPPIHGHDSPTSNPLTRARHKQDHPLIDALKELEWGDESRWTRHHDWVLDRDTLSYLSTHFSRNESLLGRDDELMSLRDMFDAPYNTEIKRRVCLYGLGGVGKSRIAFEYAAVCQCRAQLGAHKARPRPKHTFWIRAGNEIKFNEDCRRIGDKIREADNLKHSYPEDAIDFLRTWLDEEEKDPWLIVLDGLDNIEHANNWAHRLNAHDRGQILITTTNRGVARCLDVHEDTVIEVKELAIEPARKLLWNERDYPDTAVRPSDEELDKLLALIYFRSPLLIKWVGRYLSDHYESNVSVESLIKRLKTQDGQDNFMQNIHRQQDHLRPIISIVLRNFVDGRSSQELDIKFLLICACFSTIEPRLLSPWMNDQIEGIDDQLNAENCPKINELLTEFRHRSFVEKNQEGEFEMHYGVRRCILAHFKEKEGSKLLLDAYDAMLQCLWYDYTSLYNEAQGEQQSWLRKTSQLKGRYMRHFEHFLAYIYEIRGGKQGGFEDFKFSYVAAKAILEFGWYLATTKRVDHAIVVLQFVYDQRINDGEIKRVNRTYVEIDLQLELARLYHQKFREVQDENHLKTAMIYADEAYRESKSCECLPKEWIARKQRCEILLSQGKIHQGSQEIQALELFFKRMPQERRKEYQLTELRAELMLLQGGNLNKELKVLESRNMLLNLARDMKRNMPNDPDLVSNILLRLAYIDMEIPVDRTLIEAERILDAHLSALQIRYYESIENPVFWTATLQSAICKLRQRKPKKRKEAVKALADLLKAVKQSLGLEHGFTKRVARTYRDSLYEDEVYYQSDLVASHYGIEKVDKAGFRLGRWFLPPDNVSALEKWPLQGASDVSDDDLQVFRDHANDQQNDSTRLCSF